MHFFLMMQMRKMFPGQVAVRSGEFQEDSGCGVAHACQRELPNTSLLREWGHSSYLHQTPAVPQGSRVSKEGMFYVNVTRVLDLQKLHEKLKRAYVNLH